MQCGGCLGENDSERFEDHYHRARGTKRKAGARCYACRRTCHHSSMRARHRTERTVAAMAQRIVKRFAPEKVILFGSHATGAAGADSDVDLLVVMPLTASKADHELEIRAALRAYRVPKDVIVTTPEAFAWRRSVPGTIERTAARRGRLLYEKRVIAPQPLRRSGSARRKTIS